MAIIAGALKDSRRRTFYCKICVHFLPWINWGICSGGLNQPAYKKQSLGGLFLVIDGLLRSEGCQTGYTFISLEAR
jgi:hypothetical protein